MIANTFVSVYRILTKIGTTDAPLHHLSVYQSSRQSDNPFPLYGKKKRQEKKNEETKPVFESLYLGSAWRDLVEIRMKY